MGEKRSNARQWNGWASGERILIPSERQGEVHRANAGPATKKWANDSVNWLVELNPTPPDDRRHNNAKIHLWSRDEPDFWVRYPAIVKLWPHAGRDRVRGRGGGLDEENRPSFQILQSYGNAPGRVVFLIFDLLVVADVNVMNQRLTARRALLEKKIPPTLIEPIRYSLEFDTPLPGGSPR